MKIVIDITEDDYIKAQSGVLGWLGEIIMKGTPIKALEQDPLEIEATKLQKVYNKGFEDCMRYKE